MSIAAPLPRRVPARRIRAAGAPGALPLGISTLWLSLIVLLPLAAVVSRSFEGGLDAFWTAVSSRQAVSALRFTVFVSLVVAAVNAFFGLVVAWVLVRDEFRGKRVVNAVIDLPFALPTIVAGLVLLALYGPSGPVGINVAYTRVAVVLALLFVTLPFVVRAVQPVLMGLEREAEEAGIPQPRISVEPGRAIVGPGMVTLYEVGTIKDVSLDGGAQRRYISVDGGMSDNIRTSLYDAVYDCRLVSRAAEAPPTLSRIVGKHCESGDVVVRDCWLPEDIAPGDLLAVAATGAYCYVMASNYNRLPKPPVVAVREGQARLLLRRETEDDLLRLEV